MLTSSMKAWSMRHHWEQLAVPMIFVRLHPNVTIIERAGTGSVLFIFVTSAACSKVLDRQKLAG